MIYPTWINKHEMLFPSHHHDGWQIRCRCGWLDEPTPAGYLNDGYQRYHEHADASRIIEPLPSGMPFFVTGWGSRRGMRGILRFERCYVVKQDRESITVVDGKSGWFGTLRLPITVTRL